MKRPVFCQVCMWGILLLVSPQLPAQNPSPQSGASSVQPSRTEAAYLLPQTIFVGDSGRLVVPLDQTFAKVEPFVLDTPDKLPEAPDLVIRRIELERRGGSSRLLIDFIPYAPGILSFPSLELAAPGAIPLSITGLEVQVASILTPSQMALSEPAPPMAVPGTSFLVYGSVILVLVILFLGIGGSLWGRRHFRDMWERFRRRHLIHAMAKFLQRMEQEGGLEKNGTPGFYLTLLSGEFREFLSLFSGVNCRSLTAEEFLELPLEYAGSAGTALTLTVPERPADSPLTPGFLCRLFHTWDTLRFSGRGIDKIDLFQALKETGIFIAALDRAEREQSFSTPVQKFSPYTQPGVENPGEGV